MFFLCLRPYRRKRIHVKEEGRGRSSSTEDVGMASAVTVCGQDLCQCGHRIFTIGKSRRRPKDANQLHNRQSLRNYLLSRVVRIRSVTTIRISRRQLLLPMPRRLSPIKLEGYEIPDPAHAYLGEGTYGTVFLARETATGENVAIKQHHNIVSIAEDRCGR